MDDNNSRDVDNDDEFSGPGDVTRMTGDGTSERSRAANAAAQDTITDIPEFGRAFALTGPDQSVGDDDMINHVYGES